MHRASGARSEGRIRVRRRMWLLTERNLDDGKPQGRPASATNSGLWIGIGTRFQLKLNELTARAGDDRCHGVLVNFSGVYGSRLSNPGGSFRSGIGLERSLAQPGRNRKKWS